MPKLKFPYIKWVCKVFICHNDMEFLQHTLQILHSRFIIKYSINKYFDFLLMPEFSNPSNNNIILLGEKLNSQYICLSRMTFELHTPVCNFYQGYHLHTPFILIKLYSNICQ